MMKIVFTVAVLIACWAVQIQGDADVDICRVGTPSSKTALKEIFTPK